MTKAEKEAQIARIEKKLRKTTLEKYEVVCNPAAMDFIPMATTVFKVISRITHSQVSGDQRKTKKSRADIDAQIVKNVGDALKVL